MVGRPGGVLAVAAMVAVLVSGWTVLASQGAGTAAAASGVPAEALEVVSPRLGDHATFRTEDNRTLVVTVNRTVQTRDAFDRVRSAVLVHENFTDPGKRDALDPTMAVDRDSGTQLWSQADTWSVGIHPNWTTREYGSFGMPTGFGASILAGRTLQAGDTLAFPVYDGALTHRAVYTVQEPVRREGEWRWPVSIEIEGAPASTIFGGFGLAEGTVWLDEEAWLPARAHWETRWGGAWDWNRTDHTAGDGEVAWTTMDDLVPKRPWDHRPAWGFVPAGDGPQAPPSRGADHPIFPYKEALEYAREHVEGLQSFKGEHDRVLFMRAGPESDTSRGGNPTDQPVYETRTYTWNLTWGR